MKTKQISQVWDFMKVILCIVSVAFIFALMAKCSREKQERERIEFQSYHNGRYETIGKNEILIVKK